MWGGGGSVGRSGASAIDRILAGKLGDLSAAGLAIAVHASGRLGNVGGRGAGIP